MNLFLMGSLLAQERNTLSGKVVDAETEEPLVGASIFVNNTTYGASSNGEGSFSLRNLPKGRHEIVVSLLGYQTLAFVVDIGDAPVAPRRIKMSVRSLQLKEVDISGYSKSMWERWGKTFLDVFIGTSSFSKQCKLINYKSLRFSYDSDKRRLTVTSTEPLVVENKALGYKVTYLLEEFYIDYRSGVQFYMGYPKFEELGGSERILKRYHRNREFAYRGSMMHFFRSLYQGVLDGDFEIYRMYRIANDEKKRVKAMRIPPSLLAGGGVNLRIVTKGERDTVPVKTDDTAKDIAHDSLDYYRTVLRQPDTMDYVNFQKPLTVDSIVSSVVDGVKSLSFDDYLYIIARSGTEDPIYYQQIVRPRREPAPPTSTLKIHAKDSPIYIDQSGNYYEPHNLFSGIYWAWYSTMATLLPLDYKP
ncbi:carboxypeptidase-like regulatory domain-containing protein [Olivibacter sitiensis]|uniref:carboxypeptidase-like regulatory domain-containing protein n=1 Tax=Olivibacter sitiensis TaxID=376470 RepID=UPI00146FBD19|nr:carboxypeptidase-like regulatory domain-containing protein [Olivibacter sitiensis]